MAKSKSRRYTKKRSLKRRNNQRVRKSTNRYNIWGGESEEVTKDEYEKLQGAVYRFNPNNNQDNDETYIRDIRAFLKIFDNIMAKITHKYNPDNEHYNKLTPLLREFIQINQQFIEEKGGLQAMRDYARR